MCLVYKTSNVHSAVKVSCSVAFHVRYLYVCGLCGYGWHIGWVLCSIYMCCVHCLCVVLHVPMNKQLICCVLSFCCELVVCLLQYLCPLLRVLCIFVRPCLSVRPAVRDHWGLWLWSLPENCSFVNDTRAFCSSSVSWVGGREGGRERERERGGERDRYAHTCRQKETTANRHNTHQPHNLSWMDRETRWVS